MHSWSAVPLDEPKRSARGHSQSQSQGHGQGTFKSSDRKKEGTAPALCGVRRKWTLLREEDVSAQSVKALQLLTVTNQAGCETYSRQNPMHALILHDLILGKGGKGF